MASNDKQARNLRENAFWRTLSEGREAIFRAHGGSMRPQIRDGDLLVIRPVPASRVRIGDLVLMRDERRVLLHRLIRKRPDAWITHGDTLEQPDAPWSPGTFAGRAEARKSGTAFVSLRSLWWRAFGLAIAVLSPILERMLKWGRMLKQMLAGSKR